MPRRTHPKPSNIIPFPANGQGQSGAERAEEAHRERCREGYVTEPTQLGPVRVPCWRCRPAELRSYGGAGRSAVSASTDYQGQSQQVWYARSEEAGASKDGHSRS